MFLYRSWLVLLFFLRFVPLYGAWRYLTSLVVIPEGTSIYGQLMIVSSFCFSDLTLMASVFIAVLIGEFIIYLLDGVVIDWILAEPKNKNRIQDDEIRYESRRRRALDKERED